MAISARFVTSANQLATLDSAKVSMYPGEPMGDPR